MKLPAEDKIAQLAKTFAVASKKAVEEGKAQTYTVPVVAAAAALTVLAPANANTIKSWWPG